MCSGMLYKYKICVVNFKGFFEIIGVINEVLLIVLTEVINIF